MDNLLACLVKDVFQTSITPLDHIRRLEVRLYIDCHCQPRLPSWKPPRSVYRGPLWKADLLAYVYPLTKLLDSNVLQKLDIEIIPRRDSIFELLNEVLIPLVQQLTDKGVKVWVRLEAPLVLGSHTNL
jgi:hypothetical protein